MIKTLKFTDSEESKLFITGCTHFFHDPKWPIPLWKERGYNSSAEMTDGIINKINEVCRTTDSLMILGDFCLNTELNEFWNLIEKLNPTIYMVRGNHNNPWEKCFLNQCENYCGFEVIGARHARNGINASGRVIYLGDYVEFVWNKQMVCAFHYPVMTHNHAKEGSFMLHSHNHNKYGPSKPTTFDEGKLLECGWDTFGRPMSFIEIKEIMDKKPYKKRDDHH